MEKSAPSNILILSLDAIKQNFGKYRLPNLAAQKHLTQSMVQYGQILPVVVCLSGNGDYDLIDGFKRLKAARKLEFKDIKATLLEAGNHACKAAIMQLNWVKKTVGPFEEALILHSLFHDDGLSQVEISELINRHKSWVSRRISLVERLCDEVQEQIKLGLVSVSIGRELAKLPRGNQEAALETIRKYSFCFRETERLVSLLLSQSKWEGEAMLNYPAIILDDRVGPKPSGKAKKQKPDAAQLEKKISEIASLCNAIDTLARTIDINDEEKKRLKRLIMHAIFVLEELDRFLEEQPF